MTTRYDSDLTDAQWDIIQAHLPQHDPQKGGRPRIWPLRQIWNAIFYIEKTGCQWRMIPKDFPPKDTVWGYFRVCRDSGLLQTIRIALNKKIRVKSGKKEAPTVLIADSQSVKTGQKGGIEDLMAGNLSKVGSVISK